MAPALKNKQILFKSRPEGFPTEGNFELTTTETPQDLKDTQDVLVQLLDLSVDPYLRGRMNAAKSYFPGYELGKVLAGAAISRQCPRNTCPSMQTCCPLGACSLSVACKSNSVFARSQ